MESGLNIVQFALMYIGLGVFCGFVSYWEERSWDTNHSRALKEAVLFGCLWPIATTIILAACLFKTFEILSRDLRRYFADRYRWLQNRRLLKDFDPFEGVEPQVFETLKIERELVPPRRTLR